MRTKSKSGSIRFSMIMIIVGILSAAVPVHASTSEDCEALKGSIKILSLVEGREHRMENHDIYRSVDDIMHRSEFSQLCPKYRRCGLGDVYITAVDTKIVIYKIGRMLGCKLMMSRDDRANPRYNR
jgi:hypothetical protein